MITKSECYVVKFNSDGKYILSGHQDRTIHLWNSQTQVQVATFEGAHNREVFDISILPENNQFLSCGGDRVVYLWDILKGQWVRKFEGHSQQVNTVAVNAEANVFASGSFDGSVCLWDLMSRSFTPIQRLYDFKDSVTKVMFTNYQIIASSVDGFVRVYDLRKEKLVEMNVGHPIINFDLGIDTNFCALSCLDNTARIIDLKDGIVLNEYFGGHESSKYHSGIKFSSDNKMLVQASENGDVVVYDILNKTNRKLKHHKLPVISLDIKEQMIVSGGADGEIKLWNF